MVMTKGFRISKWYADVIDEKSGDATIFYFGELQWNFFKICFTNIVQLLQKSNLISRASFSNEDPPVFDGKSFSINSMQITGRWESKRTSVVETLLENKDGFIRWECFMPSASGQITIGQKIYKGFGYVERLTLSLKPWQIPIDILRWGRFICENHVIVWIRWEGEYEKCLIFCNGVKYVSGVLNDEVIEFGKFRLLLSEKYILRQGLLINTVFDKFLWVKALVPLGFLQMNECKWQTWSKLYENDRSIGQGWSIHEKVDCKSKENYFGKGCYGSLFTICLPLQLIFWSKRTEKYIDLPIPDHLFLGILLILLGLILTNSAMLDLWFKGNGLPMNAYPPPKLVTSGAYQLLSHPIYVGSSLLSFGLSIYCQSKSGFWFISPILTLSWLALVYGYENEDLKRRFPDYSWSTLLNLPDHTSIKSQLIDVISVYCLVLFPWLILYQSIIFIGTPSNSVSTYFEFESSIPVIEWTEIFYLLAYPYVILLPLFLQTKEQSRSFMIAGLMNIGIGIYLQFMLPFVALPREFIPTTILGKLLIHERTFDGPVGCFPSFHVSWALLSAYYYTWSFPRCKLFFYLISILISASCITTGMHSITDVLAGVLLYLACIHREILWIYVRNYFEHLANSWTAYRIGGLRIINHSLYSFLAGFIGVLVVCSLIGEISAILIVFFFSLIGAATWAHFIEQSSGLSRPFGYFGCIAGGVIGSVVVAWIYTIPIVSLLSAITLVSPWVQAVGRLRCVIQGCCHGRPTNNFLGIRIFNPKSRVCSLSQLQNTSIHITPAYSIMANILIGIFLWRLWYSDVALCLIVSLYLILIGLSRFVEEAFRGEIQTPIYSQLKLYQWLSILFVFIGMLISVMPFDDTLRLTLTYKNEYILPSILFGLINAFATGVDFPESQMKFSRLSD